MQQYTWQFPTTPESFAFLTGQYDRPIQRMAQKVAISRAKETNPKTKTVYLRQNEITGDLIVSKKLLNDKKKPSPRGTVFYTLSDGNVYTLKQIAEIVGIASNTAYYRIKNGCRDAEIVLRPRDETQARRRSA